MGVSLIFLYLVFKGLDWGEFFTALKRVDIPVLLAGMSLYVFSYFFRGIRWHLMLRNVKRIPIWRMTKFVIIGFMCNNLLPARLGEFARALVIAKKEEISARSSFASVVLERVFDGATIVILLFAMIILQPFPLWVRKMGIIAGALFVICFCLLILLGHRGEKWIEIIQRRFPDKMMGKAAGFMLKFVHGLDILKQNSLVLYVFILSFVIWGIEALNYTIIMNSLGIRLPLGAAIFILAVTNLGIMIPSSPGNVGTMQFFCVKALSLYAIAKDQALAYSLVLHAEMLIPITVLGVIFLMHMGMSLKSIRISRKSIEEMSESER